MMRVEMRDRSVIEFAGVPFHLKPALIRASRWWCGKDVREALIFPGLVANHFAIAQCAHSCYLSALSPLVGWGFKAEHASLVLLEMLRLHAS